MTQVLLFHTDPSNARRLTINQVSKSVIWPVFTILVALCPSVGAMEGTKQLTGSFRVDGGCVVLFFGNCGLSLHDRPVAKVAIVSDGIRITNHCLSGRLAEQRAWNGVHEMAA